MFKNLLLIFAFPFTSALYYFSTASAPLQSYTLVFIGTLTGKSPPAVLLTLG